jgi:hypothetical protein
LFGSTFISEAEKVEKGGKRWKKVEKGGRIFLYNNIYIIWLKQEEMEERNVEADPENQNII